MADTTQELCRKCRDKANRARCWANISPYDVLAFAENIGVYRRFCRDEKFPSLSDPGLAERIAKRPLPKGGLLVIGPNGTHKTHLLAARTCDAASRGWKARLVNWTGLLLDVRETYGPQPPRTERAVVDYYAGFDYLAIDDLGVGKVDFTSRESEASRLICYEILHRRYERLLITDISTNCLAEELTERFDERIGYRISQMCTVYTMLLEEAAVE